MFFKGRQNESLKLAALDHPVLLRFASHGRAL